MRLVIVVGVVCLGSIATASTSNQVLKDCVNSTQDYSEAATCFNAWRSEQDKIELQKLRQHLKENPRYKFGFIERERQWKEKY